MYINKKIIALFVLGLIQEMVVVEEEVTEVMEARDHMVAVAVGEAWVVPRKILVLI